MKTQKFNHEMGVHVKDAITEFKGHVTGRAQYVTGCNQYLVQPKCDKDKRKYPAAEWFDENRLSETTTGKIVLPGKVKTTRDRGACGIAPVK